MSFEPAFFPSADGNRPEVQDDLLRNQQKILGAIRSQHRGAYANHSGTITSGGTSQQVLAANTERYDLIFQNLSSEDMWLGLGAAAVANTPGSIKIPAGGIISGGFVPTNSINILAATTGSKFTCKEA